MSACTAQKLTNIHAHTMESYRAGFHETGRHTLRACSAGSVRHGCLCHGSMRGRVSLRGCFCACACIMQVTCVPPLLGRTWNSFSNVSWSPGSGIWQFRVLDYELNLHSFTALQGTVRRRSNIYACVCLHM